MKKLFSTLAILAVFINNIYAFEVINLKTRKVTENTKIITKLDKNEAKVEGKLLGIAQIESVALDEQIEHEKYRINIAWNEFVSSEGSKVTLNANELSSVILSKTNTIKLKQKIKVQGNLNTLNQSLANLQNQNNSTSEESEETNSFAIPSSAGASSPSSQDELELGEAELKTKETSGVACDARFDFNTGMATIYVEEYYVKDDGSKLVTKDCYASAEVIPISYEECEFIHEFDKEQSWKREKPYVNSSYGTKNMPCMVRGDAIPHQYDDSKCDILTLDGGNAMVQAKRFITVDSKNIYISDCEIVDKTGIEIDLRGCNVSLYNVVESSYQVFPAGKRYIMQGNQRVYIDSSCKVLLDYGKQWETKFHRYEHIDNTKNYKQGHSKEWQMYFYDFSEYEGGGKTNIKEYYTGIDHKHILIRTDVVRAASCNGIFSDNHWYDNYPVYKRPDNTTYTFYDSGVCR